MGVTRGHRMEPAVFLQPAPNVRSGNVSSTYLSLSLSSGSCLARLAPLFGGSFSLLLYLTSVHVADDSSPPPGGIPGRF